MSKLNKDILFLIFEELQNDSKSLFSCLMVNRLWCTTVIPILWRNPWCYDIDYSNKNYLFIIITSYLSDDNKKFLTRQGIQLPLGSYQSLLFDYLSFCRSINMDTINTITSIGTSLVYNQFLLQQEFYELFMKRFPELKYLDMKFIKHQIFYFPEARIRFESLSELKCDTSINSSYFYGLVQLCQYIQRLIVVNSDPNDYHGIAELIGVQKNLKYFKWKDDHDFYISGSDSYREILLALEKNASTINHLNIYFMFINNRTLQKILPKLHKLKTLVTSFVRFNDEQLKMCIYRDLEVFKIDYYELKAASIIIENSGGRVKKIFLESSYEFDDYIDNFNVDSLIFISKVYENCLSIESLSLVFPPSKQHINEFEKLLKNCKNLKSLLLAIYMNVYVYELKAASIIIENSGGRVKKIFLESSYEFDDYIDNFNVDSLIFISKVYENCLSIESLSLVFPPSKQHINEFEKLLKNCKNLKSLLLAIYMNVYVRPEEKLLLDNGKELLKTIIKSAPTNLREIRFLYDVKFSLETLEKFFKKWKGQHKLSILTCQPIYREENYIKLINKYKNNGVIKVFRCESFDNVVNMDFKI